MFCIYSPGHICTSCGEPFCTVFHLHSQPGDDEADGGVDDVDGVLVDADNGGDDVEDCG